VVQTLDAAALMDGTNLNVAMGEGEILQVRMFGFTPSRDFQSLISEEAPEALPDVLIDPFTEESEAPDDTSEEVDMATVAVEEAELPLATVPFDEAEFEEAQALQDAEEDESDGGDLAGMGDLVAALPFLGLLALFM